MKHHKLPSHIDVWSDLQDMDNVVGMGSRAFIFRLSKHPDYVVKVQDRSLCCLIEDSLYTFLERCINEERQLNFDIPIFKNMSEEEYARNFTGSVRYIPSIIRSKRIKDEHPLEGRARRFGGPIARYSEGNELILLHARPGVPCGIPFHLKFMLGSWQLKGMNDLYEQRTEMAAKMPIEAYVRLLEDLKLLDSLNIGIDVWMHKTSSGNLLMDPERRRFSLIDVNTQLEPGKRNNPRILLPMLFDFDAANSYGGSRSDQLIGSRRLILDKLLTACEWTRSSFWGPARKGPDVFLSALTYAGYEPGTSEREQIKQRAETLLRPHKRVQMYYRLTT